MGDVGAPEVLQEGDLGQGLLFLETVDDCPDGGALGDRGIPCEADIFHILIIHGYENGG